MRRVYRLLGSPKLAQALMTIWLGLIVAWVIPLQFLRISGEWAQHVVYRTPPFLAVYAGLAVCAVVCTIRRASSLPRRVAMHPRTGGGGSPHMLEVAFDERRARHALGRCGFRRIVAEPERVWALRNPFGPLGSLLLHTGIVVILAGAALSALPQSTFVGRARVTEGDSFTGTVREYFETAHGGERTASGRGPSFRLLAIRAKGVGDLPPDELGVVAEGDGRLPVVFSAGAPWLYSADTMVAAEDFSYTPQLSLIPSGSVVPEARLVPRLPRARSGVPEAVETTVAGDAFRITLRMAGDGRSVFATVARRQAAGGWRLESQGATVPVGGSYKLGSVFLRLEDVRPNVVLRVTTMRIAPLIALGILAAMVGAIMRLLFPRTEVQLRADGGRTAVTVSIDAYRDGSRMVRRLARAWEEAA